MMRVSPVLAALILVAACNSSSPTHPTGTSSTAAPIAVQPAANAKIANSSQPVTLVVSNGVATGSDPITYSFEVAGDSGFGTKIYTKEGVAPGANGQTSLTIGALPAAADYYWHARLVSGGTAGAFSATAKFSIGAAITINPPAPVSPLTGATLYTRPQFTVTNSTRQGPVGRITYRFDVASNAAFSPLLVSATVDEGTSQTSYTPTVELPDSTTIYWRATAIDAANGVSSAPSAAQTVTTTVAIDLRQAIYTRGPDVSNWPQTATITKVEQDGNAATGGAMCISFTTSDSWPSVPFFGDPAVPVYANQWYIANINGKWYAGAGEWLRPDRGWCKSGQGTYTIGPEGGWDPPMNTWTPKPGDLVGYMITTPARAWPSMATINERSNVVVQPWHDSSLQTIRK